MKYKRYRPGEAKPGEKVRIIQKIGNLNTETLGDTLWEVLEVPKENPYVVKIRELDTDYNGHWLDISMLHKVE